VVTTKVRSRAKGLFLILVGTAAYLFGAMTAVGVTVLDNGLDRWSWFLSNFEVHGQSVLCTLVGGMLIVGGAIRAMRSGR
jgi:hypothetical protein